MHDPVLAFEQFRKRTHPSGMSWPSWRGDKISFDMRRIKIARWSDVRSATEFDFETAGWIATAFAILEDTRSG